MQVLFIFLSKLVISFITRGDITWQESSQCVTEQCRSVRPSVTCVSSVLACEHQISFIRDHNVSLILQSAISEPPFDLSATTRRAIPTLYLPDFLETNIFRINQSPSNLVTSPRGSRGQIWSEKSNFVLRVSFLFSQKTARSLATPIDRSDSLYGTDTYTGIVTVGWTIEATDTSPTGRLPV
jgi:hypothetical protein